MARIINHGDWAEVVNDDGARLFCSGTVEGAQAIWAADGAALGRPDLVSAESLPVEDGTPHISDRVRETLLQLGFTSNDGSTYSRKVEGAAEAGTLSDGRRVVRLNLDATGRWFSAVDGWGKVESDLDLRDYSEPLLAVWALCPALKPAARRALVHGKPVTLTAETIAATRRWYADNCAACIAEARLYVETEGREGVRVNDLQSYVAWREQSAADDLAGKGDSSFAFLQRAVEIQTGQCVPMLAH